MQFSAWFCEMQFSNNSPIPTYGVTGRIKSLLSYKALFQGRARTFRHCKQKQASVSCQLVKAFVCAAEERNHPTGHSQSCPALTWQCRKDYWHSAASHSYCTSQEDTSPRIQNRDKTWFHNTTMSAHFLFAPMRRVMRNLWIVKETIAWWWS